MEKYYAYFFERVEAIAKCKRGIGYTNKWRICFFVLVNYIY